MNTPLNNWNDQDLLTDILDQEKHMMAVYTSSITESDCNRLRSVLSGNFDMISSDQLLVFKAMNEKGFYPVKAADTCEIENAKQSAAGLAQTLPI